jgi:hypothetical protein
MKQNQWFAVRCCCTPRKVFGFIKLPAIDPQDHLPVHRWLIDHNNHQHDIQLMSIYVNRMSCSSDYLRVFPVPMEIEHAIPEIAIYSDDRPIEFWRTILGFVEAPSED